MNKIHEPLLEIYRDKEDLSNYAFSLYYFIEELSKLNILLLLFV